MHPLMTMAGVTGQESWITGWRLDGFKWPDGWKAIYEVDRQIFEHELRRELAPGHSQFEFFAFEALAQRANQDEILFRLLDGADRVAQFYLTWTGEPEQPPSPRFTIFENLEAWAASHRKTLDIASEGVSEKI